MTASFTAARQAKRGYSWGVMLNIYTKESLVSCSSMSLSWDAILGGNPKRHMQSKGKHTVLLLGQEAVGSYFCRGKANLWVTERRIGLGRLGKIVSKTEFRIPEAP